MTKSNILHHTIGSQLPAVALLLSLATVSCRIDDTPGVNDDQPVIVTAYAAESALTRAEETERYHDHGPVTSGTYYLTYSRNSTGTNNMAEVEFEETGNGRAEVMPKRGILTWKEIRSGSALGLTNVSPEKHNGYKADAPYNNPIIFKNDETQFVAGRYIPYGEDNTNDILLGSNTSQNRNSNYVDFDLHHCMARVRVIVETHPQESSFDPLDGLLDEAKVDITNVVLKPYSFIPYITDKTSFADAVSIYPAGNTMEGYCTFGEINLLNTLDAKDETWAETGYLEDQVSYPGGEYFITYDILLPPQQLRADENRPRLRITVKDEEKGEKIYSGVLPHIMFNESENPLQLEFLAEYLLTIRTVISNEPPELVFMPVKVVEWVDKGSYDLDAKQAGIYDEDDFLKMIECYEDYNETKLLRYGILKDDKWIFEVFRNLSLSRDKIAGKMKLAENKKDYSFNFNTWFTVKVDGEEYTEVTLRDLLSGNMQ